MQIFKNEFWEEAEPAVSVVIAVFNRPDTLQNAMKSVEQQTFRDFEYIIVNDGENIDDIVIDFMNSTTIPVLYVKKENGGVHTARNIGTRMARGDCPGT